MGKPLSRPDCLRQNPSCLGKGEEEDGYIEDCYVPQRSIYDTMRINEQIDQGSKLNQPSKTTIDRTEIGTLSSNGTLGTSNAPDSKSLDTKKLDERVIFDALKLSNDTLKSAPVPPRRRPNPDRKENVNRRSWKAFMPPNFPDFSERIEASLSEVSEAGTSNHSLHDKTEFSQLLPESTRHSNREQTGSVSPTSEQSRTPALSSAVSANQSLEHTADSRCQHGQSFDYYNDSEYENDPLLAQENATSLCTRSKPGHNFPSATWPRALKSFIKGSGSESHHKVPEMVYEECIIETLPLSPCLSDEVLDESSDFLIVPNLREKTESELKFEEDERKILMEADEEWEDIQSEGACSAVVNDGARNLLSGKVKEMNPIIPDNTFPNNRGSTNNIDSLPPFPDDDLSSESSHWLISEESHQEFSCYSAVSAANMTRRRYHKLGSYSDSESDSDQLFLELEQQCQKEDDESSDLHTAVSGLGESNVNAKNVPHIMPNNNLHTTAQDRHSPELERGEEDTPQITKDECPTSDLNSNDQSDIECVGEMVSIVTDMPATKTQDLLTDCKEVEVNTCPTNVTDQCSANNPEEAVSSTSTLQEETNTNVNLPGHFLSLVETSPSQHLSGSSEVSLPQSKLSPDASEPLEEKSHDAVNVTLKSGKEDSLEPLPHVYYSDSPSPVCDTERDSCLGSSEQPDESWTCEASFQSTDFISADSCDDVSDGGEMVISSTEGSNILPDATTRETCITSTQTFTSGGELQELQDDNETSSEVDEAAGKTCKKHNLLVDSGITNDITEKTTPAGDSDIVIICDAVDESSAGGPMTTCLEGNSPVYSGTETAVDLPLEPGLVETHRDCSHANDGLPCEGAGCPPHDSNKSQLCVFTDCPSALLSLDAVSKNTVTDNSEILISHIYPNLDSSTLEQEDKNHSFTGDLSASHMPSGETFLRCTEQVEDPLVLASQEFLSSDTAHQVNVPCSDLHESHEDCSEYSTASESTPDSMSPIHYADSQNNEFVQADENDCKGAGCKTQAVQNLCNSEAQIVHLPDQNNAHLKIVSEGPCACAQLSDVSDSCCVSVNISDHGLQGGGVYVPFQTAGYLSEDATCADVPSSQICTDSSNLSSGSDDEPAADKEVTDTHP